MLLGSLAVAAAFGALFPSFGIKPSAPTLGGDSAPSWPVLQERVDSTATGKRLAQEAAARAQGLGSAHTDAQIRLFDATSEDEIRVTLFRDTAAWCPYCQKVWLLLEEKRIPYKVSKINMRSYGSVQPQHGHACSCHGTSLAIRV